MYKLYCVNLDNKNISGKIASKFNYTPITKLSSECDCNCDCDCTFDCDCTRDCDCNPDCDCDCPY
jgi:hypothetical protein